MNRGGTTPIDGETPSSDGITVVIATCNRAAILAETLEFMCRTDRRELHVEFVIVDNNSADDTRDVVSSFENRLAIRYLHEPTAGKNHALNLALQVVEFRPIVVFTDDDVRPATDWFHAILEVSRRWPSHHVFGGKISPTWPMEAPPAWVHDGLIKQFAFASHDLGVEGPYSSRQQPFGPNFWLRRDVLGPDVRFDINFGPGTGTLGDEMVFLHSFQSRGLEIIYSPQARVEHRIQPDGISASKLVQRALMVGRVGPNMYGLCRPETLVQRPWLWRLQRRVRLSQAKLALLLARMHPHADRRLVRSIQPLIDIGYNVESLRLAADSNRVVRDTSPNARERQGHA